MSVKCQGEFNRIDIEQVRRDNPIAGVVAPEVKLHRAGREFKGRCPFHSEKTPSFTIFDGGHRFQCFGCGAAGDVVDYIQQAHGVDFLEAVRMLAGESLPRVEVAKLPPAVPDHVKIAKARALWAETKPIQGTPAQDYLASRGIICRMPDTLRFHPSIAYWDAEAGDKPIYIDNFPAMIAASHSASGELEAVQRTYLLLDGSGKAPVPKPKKALGNMSSRAIRLTPVAASLIVCEGIEDGLSILQDCNQSVWVAGGAGIAQNMLFPDAVQSIVIAADNDENKAGELAAIAAADAFALRGLQTRIIYPDKPHKDFNSQLVASLRQKDIL